MRIGAPFNPYKLFRGAFAPYWLLEHRSIGAGAKLCYIRLLGFAGKDARCYPSLERLGTSLGVSERQARDYVKELERAGLIKVEQRGLRKTNVYFFVWTAELESPSNFVPDNPHNPEDEAGGAPQEMPPDRNNRSGQDRNGASAPDRNTPSGPIGINSVGINSLESSSSSAADRVAELTTTTNVEQRPVCAKMAPGVGREGPNRAAQTIICWAKQRGLQRLRSDRRMGLPEKELLAQWSRIFDRRGIADTGQIFALLDAARAKADRSGEWRNWSFLNPQIQLAAERLPVNESISGPTTNRSPFTHEDAACEWARNKEKIRTQIPEIPFSNWFACTRQVERKGSSLLVAVPDEPTRDYLENEYAEVIARAVAAFGILEIQFMMAGPSPYQSSSIGEQHGTVQENGVTGIP